MKGPTYFCIRVGWINANKSMAHIYHYPKFIILRQMMTCMKEKMSQTWHKGLFFNDIANKKLFDDMNLLSLYSIYSFLFLKYSVFILRIIRTRMKTILYQYHAMNFYIAWSYSFFTISCIFVFNLVSCIRKR